MKGVPETIVANRFAAEDVQGKYIHVAEADFLRAFEDKGDETSWVKENVKDIKAWIPDKNGCEVIGGKAVKFTAA